MGKLLKRIFMCSLAFVWLAAPLSAQSVLNRGGDLLITSFHTQGLGKDGEIVWTLDGESAELRGNATELSGFTARMTSPEKPEYTLTSNRCRYLHTLREIKSDSPLTLVSKGIKASGIGYDIYLDSRLVRIRSAVKIVIQRNKIRKEQETPHEK